MSDEIRVGDRFLIEVEVTGKSEALVYVTVPGVTTKEEGSSYFTPQEVLSGRRLPRQIKAGDRVTWGSLSGGRGTVVHVRGEWAVVDDGHYQGCPIDRPCTVELSRLTLDDKA